MFVSKAPRRITASALAFISRPITKFTQHVSFDIKKCDVHGLEEAPADSGALTRDQGLSLYRSMQTIRHVEEQVFDLNMRKMVLGPCHSYAGQEACAVGLEAAIDDTDHVITSYRAHGFAVTRGVPLRQILAEITGRSGGVAKGRGGPMHLYGPNFYGGNGVVGSQIPLGAGIALACKYRSNNQISLAVYGDGASNQGQLFEAFNMAALWKLPCIFVCENNRYGKGTAMERASANTDFYTRGDVVPGIRADGMDVLCVREAARFARDHCRSGKGPMVLELMTYRFSGHFALDLDTQRYRSQTEEQDYSERDPILKLKRQMLHTNMASSEEFEKIDHEILAEVEEAAQFATSDPEPPLDHLCSDIYHNSPSMKVRGVHPWAKLVSVGNS